MSNIIEYYDYTSKFFDWEWYNFNNNSHVSVFAKMFHQTGCNSLYEANNYIIPNIPNGMPFVLNENLKITNFTEEITNDKFINVDIP